MPKIEAAWQAIERIQDTVCPTYREGRETLEGRISMADLNLICTALGEKREVDHTHVVIPIFEKEAMMMVALGTDWLRRNAPHQLKDPSADLVKLLRAGVSALTYGEFIRWRQDAQEALKAQESMK